MLTVDARKRIETLLQNLGINRVSNPSKKEELWYELKVKVVADHFSEVFQEGYEKGNKKC